MKNFAGSDYRERRRQIARDVQRRLVAHIAAGGTTDFAASLMENDASAYTDPTRAQLEIDELFLKLPLLVGLSQDAPGPRDCLLFEELGFSIVIVRGTDGRLRAFRNMCAHRGSKIVRANVDRSCERRSRLTCPFHAWSFNLDGTVAGVPGRAGFEGIDLSLRRLVSVPIAEWEGLIFLRIGGEGALDIPTFLGSFAPELLQLEMGKAVPLKASGLTADTNWKYAVDTYGEGYHFGSLHSSTIGTTHYSNVAAFDEFGVHWRIHFAEKSLRLLVATPEDDWPEPDFGGVHFLFPNTILVVSSVEPGKGFVRIFRLFPGPTPGTTSCRVSVYALGGFVSDDYRTQFAKDNCEDIVTQEDYSVAVEAYKNLAAAPAGFKVVYGRNEIALQAFHRAISRVLTLGL